MKQSFRLLSSAFFILFKTQNAFAAACCGGGFAAPSIISGDDRAQFSSSLSYSEVSVDNVDSQGVWRKWEHHQEVQTLRLEGATLVSDRFQAGFALPVIRRARLGQTYSGLGDVSASLGYEYLTDWDYHPYQPKGVAFLQLTLPTGKSKAESDLGALDSRGNGFFALGAGSLLSKAFGKWDFFTLFEMHRSFQKQVNTLDWQGTLKPGFGGNLGIGGGFNTKTLRFGSSLTWTYEDPIQIEGSFQSLGTLERYATAALSVSYLESEEWSGMVSYADQTWFGSPLNTSLGQTLAMQVMRRFSR